MGSGSAGASDTATGATFDERTIVVWGSAPSFLTNSSTDRRGLFRRRIFFFSLSTPDEEDANAVSIERCTEIWHQQRKVSVEGNQQGLVP
ncbi:hypothetical protein ACLOJK_022936 [Asimina triloba]